MRCPERPASGYQSLSGGDVREPCCDAGEFILPIAASSLVDAAILGSPHRELIVAAARPSTPLPVLGLRCGGLVGDDPSTSGALKLGRGSTPAAAAIAVLIRVRCASSARPASVSRAAHACRHSSGRRSAVSARADLHRRGGGNVAFHRVDVGR